MLQQSSEKRMMNILRCRSDLIHSRNLGIGEEALQQRSQRTTFYSCNRRLQFARPRLRHEEQREIVAQSSTAPETRPAPLRAERSTSPSGFVPAGGTNLVYNARDEGLHFADGSERPLRRVRYNTKQTWRWRNPETGASLRVSYPSEEIVLIPVSVQ